MNVTERASAAKRLRDDETYQDIISTVKDAQMNVFLKPDSTDVARQKAHEIIRALFEIEGEVNRRIDAQAFEAKKGQHRAND